MERELRCAVRQGCETPIIYPDREVYYVLGGGAIINCKACAEKRGWGDLNKWVLPTVQRSPPVAQAQEQFPPLVEPAPPPSSKLPVDPDDDLRVRLEYMDTGQFCEFLSDAGTTLDQLESPVTRAHLVNLIQECLSGDVFLFHNLTRLLSWWNKLQGDVPSYPPEWCLTYDAAVDLFFGYVRCNLLRHRDFCVCCSRTYDACLADLLEHTPPALMTTRHQQTCQELLQLHVSILDMQLLSV